jgi:hypothetical protein
VLHLQLLPVDNRLCNESLCLKLCGKFYACRFKTTDTCRKISAIDL